MARQISSWKKALNRICEENHASMQKPRSMREIAWWMRFSIPGDALHTKRSCNRSSAAWPWQRHCKPMTAIILGTCIINLISSHDTRLSHVRSGYQIAFCLRGREFTANFRDFRNIFSKFQLRARRMSSTLQKSFDFPSRDIYLFFLPIISRRTSLVYHESTFRCVLNSGN